MRKTKCELLSETTLSLAKLSSVGNLNMSAELGILFMENACVYTYTGQ